MYHGDVPDDIGQALVQQREDDNVQRGPLGLETEPEAKPLAGPGGPPEVGGALHGLWAPASPYWGWGLSSFCPDTEEAPTGCQAEEWRPRQPA